MLRSGRRRGGVAAGTLALHVLLLRQLHLLLYMLLHTPAHYTVLHMEHNTDGHAHVTPTPCAVTHSKTLASSVPKRQVTSDVITPLRQKHACIFGSMPC